MRRERPRQRERNAKAGGIVDGAFAVRMTIDMCADDDALGSDTGQIEREDGRLSDVVLAGDAHARRRPRAVGRAGERYRRFRADAERRDAGATAPPARAGYRSDP